MLEPPPVEVFDDGKVKWLIDGFHRWHAHKMLGLSKIPARVRPGKREDALEFSLSANAKHGWPRLKADYARSYEIATRNKIVDPADIDGIELRHSFSLPSPRSLSKPDHWLYHSRRSQDHQQALAIIGARARKQRRFRLGLVATALKMFTSEWLPHGRRLAVQVTYGNSLNTALGSVVVP
jgi:hypothetical protein